MTPSGHNLGDGESAIAIHTAAQDAELIERLRDWPAVDQGDALDARFVGSMMVEAASRLAGNAVEIERLTGLLRCAAPYAQDLARYCNEPEKSKATQVYRDCMEALTGGKP